MTRCEHVRTLRAVEAAWVVGLCLSICGCDRPPLARASETIGVNEYTCRPECHDIAIWLSRGGDATIGDNDGNSDSISLAPGQFDRISERLVRTPFFSSTSDLREFHRFEQSANISVTVAGQFRVVFLPGPEAGDSTMNDTASQLLRFVDDVRREMAPFKNRADRAARARLADVARLREVTYHAEGCYGSCPIYNVNFFSAGHAVLYRRKAMEPAIRAVAPIRFSHVIELLRAAHFTYLERHYAVKSEDAFGSTLRLDYDTGESFWSEGHDSTQWSPPYRDLAARIDQLVLDTTWTSIPDRRSRKRAPAERPR